MAQQGTEPAGFLVLEKPPGMSSARALSILKRRLGRGVKLGHAGTLDPFATGVLVALVGAATRQCERIMSLPKGYEATLKLGVTTPTLDPESAEVPFASGNLKPPIRAEVQSILRRFEGEIQQTPPAYSAIKVGGKRAYDLARRGEVLKLVPRGVMVYRLELRSYEWPELRIFVECGRGFYVRSLARDIGEALGTGAYLTALRRTVVGAFDETMAVAPDAESLPILPQSWLDERA